MKKFTRGIVFLPVAVFLLTGSLVQAQIGLDPKPLIPNADGIGQDPSTVPTFTRDQRRQPNGPQTTLTDVLALGAKTGAEYYTGAEGTNPVLSDQIQGHTNNALAEGLKTLSNSSTSKLAQKGLSNLPIVDSIKAGYEAYQGDSEEAGHTFIKGWLAAGVTYTTGLVVGTTGFVPISIAIVVGTGAKYIYDKGRENYGTGDPAKVKAFENKHKAWKIVQESGGRIRYEEALADLNHPQRYDETGELAAQRLAEYQREQYNREHARDAAKNSRDGAASAARANRPTGCSAPRPPKPPRPPKCGGGKCK